MNFPKKQHLTKITSPIAKSTSPRLSDTTFFAHWRNTVESPKILNLLTLESPCFHFLQKLWFPQQEKVLAWVPPRGGSDRWHGPKNWWHSSQKALTIDRRGGENSDSNNLFFEVMKVTLDVFYILAVFAAKWQSLFHNFLFDSFSNVCIAEKQSLRGER